MRTVGHPKRAGSLPDVLLTLDGQYAGVLALLDGCTANRQMVGTVPDRSGLLGCSAAPTPSRPCSATAPYGGATVRVWVPA
jgi:hypothetical protein